MPPASHVRSRWRRLWWWFTLARVAVAVVADAPGARRPSHLPAKSRPPVASVVAAAASPISSAGARPHSHAHHAVTVRRREQCASHLAAGEWVTKEADLHDGFSDNAGFKYSDEGKRCGFHAFQADEARELLENKVVAFIGNSVQRRTMHAIVDILTGGVDRRGQRQRNTEKDKEILANARAVGGKDSIMDFERDNHAAQFVTVDTSTGERVPPDDIHTATDACGVLRSLVESSGSLWSNRIAREKGEQEPYTMEHIITHSPPNHFNQTDGSCMYGCRDRPMECAPARQPPKSQPGKVKLQFHFYGDGGLGMQAREVLSKLDDDNSPLVDADIVVLAPTTKSEYERTEGKAFDEYQRTLETIVNLTRKPRVFLIRGPTDVHHSDEYTISDYEAQELFLRDAVAALVNKTKSDDSINGSGGGGGGGGVRRRASTFVYLPTAITTWRGIESSVLHHDGGGSHFMDRGRLWLANLVLNAATLYL